MVVPEDIQADADLMKVSSTFSSPAFKKLTEHCSKLHANSCIKITFPRKEDRVSPARLKTLLEAI